MIPPMEVPPIGRNGETLQVWMRMEAPSAGRIGEVLHQEQPGWGWLFLGGGCWFLTRFPHPHSWLSGFPFPSLHPSSLRRLLSAPLRPAQEGPHTVG